MTESLHSRRTIVKGAAWSLPVIAAVAATPAYAASLACTSPGVLTYTVSGTNLVVTNTGTDCTWSGPLYVSYQVYNYPFDSSPYLVDGIAATKVLDRQQRVYISQVALGTRTLGPGESLVLPITPNPVPSSVIPNFSGGAYSMHQTFILTANGTYRLDGSNTVTQVGDYGIDVYADVSFDKENIPG
ncbi:hypothetical protein [Microbacterium sp.]|uniref:hypothetical protein n=1 Tax=Microbacterium sp. TaxID=51671 RepID=UPI0033408F1D